MSRAYRTSPGNSGRRIDPQRIRRAGVDKEQLSVEHPLVYRNGKIALDIANESRDMLTVNPTGLAVDPVAMSSGGSTPGAGVGACVVFEFGTDQLINEPSGTPGLSWATCPTLGTILNMSAILSSYNPNGDISVNTAGLGGTVTVQPGVYLYTGYHVYDTSNSGNADVVWSVQTLAGSVFGYAPNVRIAPTSSGRPPFLISNAILVNALGGATSFDVRSCETSVSTSTVIHSPAPPGGQGSYANVQRIA